MDFPKSAARVVLRGPWAEAVSPGRIVLPRKRFQSLVAKSYKSMLIKQALSLSPSLNKISGLIEAKNVLKIGLALSVLCPLFMPWITVLFLGFKNFGLPRVLDNQFDRSDDVDKLLNGIAGLKRFYFLYGSHATGKSTLVRQALARRGHGCIYVLVEPGSEVTLQKLALKIYLATNCLLLVHFNLSSWIMKACGFGFQPRFEQLFEMEGLLHQLANRYKSMFGKNLMLVLDGVNSLPPKVMQELLGMAKNLADSSSLIIVFVGTGGQLPYICSETSALSRGTFRIIPPILEKELKEHVMKLEDYEDIPSQTIERVIDLVGGKISNLLWCLKELQEGMSLDELEVMYEETFTFNSFSLAGLMDLENRAWVKLLFQELKAHGGEMHVSKFQEIVPRAEIWRLNGGSVFTIDDKKMVRYECVANQRYAEKLLSRLEARGKSSTPRTEASG